MTAEHQGPDLTVPVLLNGWQIECCGEARSIGDVVSWQLNWDAEYAMLPSTMRLRARLERYPAANADPWYSTGTPVPDATGSTTPALARVGGLSVFVLAPDPLPADVTLTGVLHEDHHIDIPEEFPETTGRITAVWLVSWEYEQRATGLHRVEGSARYDETAQVPKWLPSTKNRTPHRRRRLTNAVLVHLNVATG